jgi:hypothetical protein
MAWMKPANKRKREGTAEEVVFEGLSDCIHKLEKTEKKRTRQEKVAEKAAEKERPRQLLEKQVKKFFSQSAPFMKSQC